MTPPKHDILISQQRIEERIPHMAQELIQRIPEGEIHTLTILEGGKYLQEKLIHALTTLAPQRSIQESFIQVSSYGLEEETTGKIELIYDLEENIEGKTIVIIEDIIDTGLTLSFIKNLLLQKKGAKQCIIVSLLNKPNARKTDVEPDIQGFTIGDHFVFGCGLDYKGFHRDLPYIAEVIDPFDEI